MTGCKSSYDMFDDQRPYKKDRIVSSILSTLYDTADLIENHELAAYDEELKDLLEDAELLELRVRSYVSR